MQRTPVLGCLLGLALTTVAGIGGAASSASATPPVIGVGPLLVEASGNSTYGLGDIDPGDPSSVDPLAMLDCDNSRFDGASLLYVPPFIDVPTDSADQLRPGHVLGRLQSCSDPFKHRIGEFNLATGAFKVLPVPATVVGYGPVPGTLLAVSQSAFTNTVKVLDRRTGALLWSQDMGQGTLQISADGLKYAGTYGTGWVRATYGDSNSSYVNAGSTLGASGMTSSADLSTVAVATGGRLKLTNLDTTTTTDVGSAASSPTWSPDGAHIAVNESTPAGLGLSIYSVATDHWAATNLDVDATSLLSVWSPDGTHLLVISVDSSQHVSKVWFVDPVTGATTDVSGLDLFRGDYTYSIQLQWAPDSSRLATVVSQQGDAANLLTVVDPTGAVITQVPLSHSVDGVGPWLGCTGTCPAVGLSSTPCTVTGTPKDDLLKGTNGDDVLCGGGGNDVLRPGAGHDIVIGGRGTDTVDESDSPKPVQVNLMEWSVHGNGTDRLTSIENAIGSSHDDQLADDWTNNRLSGGAGDDYLAPSWGIDRILGGSGHDDVSYVTGPGPVHVNLNRGTATSPLGAESVRGVEDADGTRFRDTMVGDAGRNSLYGGDGADEIWGRGGIDHVAGGGGSDTLYGGKGRDKLAGGLMADKLFGGPGADTCYAGEWSVKPYAC